VTFYLLDVLQSAAAALSLSPAVSVAAVASSRNLRRFGKLFQRFRLITLFFNVIISP
jgi:hypothetical protein